MNEITKIENLDDLTKLKNLNLVLNKITKIENIEHLTNLERLYLHYNPITKIENIDNLTKLKTFYLCNSKFSYKDPSNKEYIKKLKARGLEINK